MSTIAGCFYSKEEITEMIDVCFMEHAHLSRRYLLFLNHVGAQIVMDRSTVCCCSIHVFPPLFASFVFFWCGGFLGGDNEHHCWLFLF